jgi:biotin synthase-like enzyme
LTDESEDWFAFSGASKFRLAVEDNRIQKRALVKFKRIALKEQCKFISTGGDIRAASNKATGEGFSLCQVLHAQSFCYSKMKT